MKLFLFFLFFAVVFPLNAQPEKLNHTFSFEGYRLEINSMATDERGNYLFCGYIQSDETVEQKDTMIKARMEMYADLRADERYAIILQTDQSFAVQNVTVFAALFPSNLIYDKENNLFWMGASHSTYLSKDEDMFGASQMLLVKIDLNQKDLRYYSVETKFSCKMHELLLINKTLTCIGTKETGQNEERQETPVIVEVSDTKFHKNADVSYFPILDLLRTTVSTAETANHVILTEAVASKNGIYFVANRFPFGQIPTLGIEIYHYENGKLTFNHFTPSQPASNLHYVTNIQLVRGNLLVSYVPGYDSKYFVLEKLTAELRFLSALSVPDLQYPDFGNELLVLSNGKIVAAGLNAQKTWSYFIYSEDGQLEKEIDTKMPKDLAIGFTKAFNENDFICLFYANGKSVANQLFVYSSH